MDFDYINHAVGTVGAMASLMAKSQARAQATIEAQQKALEAAGKQLEANAQEATSWKREIDRLTTALQESNCHRETADQKIAAMENNIARHRAMAIDFEAADRDKFKDSESKHFFRAMPVPRDEG